MTVRTLELDGYEVSVGDVTVEPDSSDHPAALWTRQVIAGGNVCAVVRNVDPGLSFDDVHRIAEHVAAALDLGAADVAFTLDEGQP